MATLAGTTGDDILDASALTGPYTLTGLAGNDVLIGSAAADTLDGGAGEDYMQGGAGNDVYIVDNANDQILENESEGTDTVKASLSFSLAPFDNVENITLTGSTAGMIATGNDYDNTLDGSVSTVANTLRGGLGDDTYVIGTGDVIQENSGEGTDTVMSAVSASLASFANVENLTLTGTTALTATGNGGVNVIIGNIAANTLDGGAGADTLKGGDGNDIYMVDDANDVVVETNAITTQIDEIKASVSYSLATTANVEKLTLTGSSNIDATGNALVNILTGNSGSNTLDGGAGADTMVGGAGNDTYVVSVANDVITEVTGGGTDTVRTDITYSIAALTFVENITLTGTGNVNATGNAGVNVLTGNSGNNVLDGGAGADSMVGGLGDDTYAVDNASDSITENGAEGTDTVLFTSTVAGTGYTLAANVENLTLQGTLALNGTGNTGNNIITGNSAANTLNGGTAGTDSLVGLAGNDVYVVDHAGITIVEASSAGTDQVNASVSFDLSAMANVENLTLTGSGNINGTGNSLANQINGNSGNNVLDGGAGNDVLKGGDGNDTYVIDSASDVIVETSTGGTDTVQVGASFTGTYTLSAFLENVTLLGSANSGATGSAAANIITGNSGNNLLKGGSGADTIDGGLGNDTIDGGLGADTMNGNLGNDTFTIDNTSDVLIEGSSGGTDLALSSVTYSLASYTEVENLTLTGAGNINATGNTNDNILTGNSGNNTLDGGTATSADTLIGGDGNDTYIIYDNSEVVTEVSGGSHGTDTVTSALVSLDLADYANVENIVLTGSLAIDGTGDVNVNVITGNSGNNTLDGGGGADTLIGGGGNDVFIVDDPADTVTGGAGTDEVQSSITFSIAANAEIENLTLTGTGNVDATGNTGDNVITGNTGNNTLDGGGDSAGDTLIGGGGNDVYVIHSGNEVVTGDTGTDTVTSSLVSLNVGNSNYTSVENATLTGTSNLNLTGDANDNVLTGNSGDNTLDGGGDSAGDSLIGGAGNDTYVIYTGSEVITESSGTDIVKSGAVSIDLTSYSGIENATLTGSTALNLTGDANDNVLVGNTGANSIDGGGGMDTLTGGTGVDNFLITHAPAAGTNATITDFDGTATTGDVLDISSILTGYVDGTSVVTDFVHITASGSDAIVSVDADGTTGGSVYVQVATLIGGSALAGTETALEAAGTLFLG